MIIRMLEKLDNFGDLIGVLAPHLHERIRFFPATKHRELEAPPRGGRRRHLGQWCTGRIMRLERTRIRLGRSV